MQINLSEHDSGQTLELSVGDTLDIHLPENPTTGYRWSPDPPIPPGLAVVWDENIVTPGAVGAGGERVIKLRVEGQGPFELHLHHWREWEGPASEIGAFHLRGAVR